ALVIAGAATPASAQDEIRFDIAPQALTTALNEFGVQSHRSVLFTTEVTGEKLTGGVAAQAEPEAALAQLLRGTGLTFRRNGDTFLIVQAGEGGTSPQAGNAVEALIVTAQKREEDIQ